MLTKVRLEKRTSRRWLGNGFGYQRASYYMRYGSWTVAVVEPSAYAGWNVTEDDDGPSHYFETLSDVRDWGNKRITPKDG